MKHIHVIIKSLVSTFILQYKRYNCRPDREILEFWEGVKPELFKGEYYETIPQKRFRANLHLSGTASIADGLIERACYVKDTDKLCVIVEQLFDMLGNVLYYGANFSKIFRYHDSCYFNQRFPLDPILRTAWHNDMVLLLCDIRNSAYDCKRWFIYETNNVTCLNKCIQIYDDVCKKLQKLVCEYSELQIKVRNLEEKNKMCCCKCKK